jgi:hypothetical protein
MKLNVKLINQRLSVLGWSRAEYARQLSTKRKKYSRQLVNYYLKTEIKNIKIIDKLAKPLQLNPIDLII